MAEETAILVGAVSVVATFVDSLPPGLVDLSHAQMLLLQLLVSHALR